MPSPACCLPYIQMLDLMLFSSFRVGRLGLSFVHFYMSSPAHAMFVTDSGGIKFVPIFHN